MAAAKRPHQRNRPTDAACIRLLYMLDLKVQLARRTETVRASGTWSVLALRAGTRKAEDSSTLSLRRASGTQGVPEGRCGIWRAYPCGMVEKFCKEISRHLESNPAVQLNFPG